ncbi:hypothetical protein HAX54_029546, partial [Datura stramonium]|nr:hypothetical protein [Datura stramonium]
LSPPLTCSGESRCKLSRIAPRRVPETVISISVNRRTMCSPKPYSLEGTRPYPKHSLHRVLRTRHGYLYRRPRPEP